MAASCDFVEQKSKKSLSNNLMQMKFMQRKQETDQQKQREERIRRNIEASHWTTDSADIDLQSVIVEPSFVVCEELLTIGRMSFNGFNPEIEKLHQDILKDDELDRAEMRENEDQISDSEMASRMEGINDTISKKFGKKRQRKPSSNGGHETTSTNKKVKIDFMKPKID